MTKRAPSSIKSTKSTKRKKKIDKHTIGKRKKQDQRKPIKENKPRLDKADSTKKRNDPSGTGILDPNYFDPDMIHRSTTMGYSLLIRHARKTLLKLLKAGDYRPCLALLTALVETCKFSTLSYWKVAEEIVQSCRPDDVPDFLGSVVAGLRSPHDLRAWKERLLYILNDEGYTTFMEHIESSAENHDKNQSISKLVALAMYEAWEQMANTQQVDKNNLLRLLYATEQQLSKAYQVNPTDRYIIRAYLKVLDAIAKIHNDDSTEKLQQQSKIKLKQIVDTALQNEINDPELNCTLLHYGSQELDNDMNFAITLCSEDPVADARIKFLPAMKSMKSVSVLDPDYNSVIMARVGLIVDRLEHGVTDTYTLDELDDVLDVTETSPPHIKYSVISFLASIELPATLGNLQLGVNDDDIIAMDTLEFLKYKVTEMIQLQQ